VDAPMIVSIGGAYAGFERFLLALDLRYIDYSKHSHVRSCGFQLDRGRQRSGLGQHFPPCRPERKYQVTECSRRGSGTRSARIPSATTRRFFNIASPTVIQHAVYFGVSQDVTATFKISLAYAHFFRNSISGPIISPLAGPLAGTNVTASAYADSIIAGGTFKF